MNYKEKIKQLQQKINNQLLPLIDSDYILLDYPDHPNLGDTLIWGGKINFFSQTKHNCLFSASLNTFYYRKISEYSIIALHGGGNFGDLYPEIHNFRRKIIELYPNNRVIIFPQTVWYDNQQNVKADEVFFAAHPNVTMCARDAISYAFMQEHFPKNKVLLVPDMAFFVDFENYGKINHKTTGRTLFAKRTDKELKLGDNPKFIPSNAEIHDWPTVERTDKKYAPANYIVGWLNFFANIKGIKSINRLIDLARANFYRTEYIKDCVKFINNYDTIYATRLHIAIASAMMGKNVFLMDNSYGKNYSFYDTWMTDWENINKTI